MNSEKVKEIKKASKCCNIDRSCADCPYSKIEHCLEVFNDNILNVINGLESENERLLESCKNCHYIKDLEIANGHAKELKNQIAEFETKDALFVPYEDIEEFANMIATSPQTKQTMERLINAWQKETAKEIIKDFVLSPRTRAMIMNKYGLSKEDLEVKE
jgi:hypothetical protein